MTYRQIKEQRAQISDRLRLLSVCFAISASVGVLSIWTGNKPLTALTAAFCGIDFAGIVWLEIKLYCIRFIQPKD